MVQKVKRIIWIIKNFGYWIEEKREQWLFGFIEYIWNKWFTSNMKWAFGREVVNDIMNKNNQSYKSKNLIEDIESCYF